MSFKDRMVVINMLLLTLIGSYILHYRSGYTSDISEVVVEARGEDTVIPTEVQPERIQVLPEPVEAPELSQKEQIIAYIVEVFGEDAPEAFNVLRCENKNLDPLAVNTFNSNGSIDEGIFQINSIHGQKNMLDWRANIDYAYKIFSRQGWTPWSCSHRVDVKPFYEI